MSVVLEKMDDHIRYLLREGDKSRKNVQEVRAMFGQRELLVQKMLDEGMDVWEFTIDG